jgi:hypothetical protein
MTAGPVHAWGRLFETTRVRARVAQKTKNGENPSQPKGSSSLQSRASPNPRFLSGSTPSLHRASSSATPSSCRPASPPRPTHLRRVAPPPWRLLCDSEQPPSRLSRSIYPAPELEEQQGAALGRRWRSTDSAPADSSPRWRGLRDSMRSMDGGSSAGAGMRDGCRCSRSGGWRATAAAGSSSGLQLAHPPRFPLLFLSAVGHAGHGPQIRRLHLRWYVVFLPML